MHLVQLLLPLYDKAGAPQPRPHFAAVRQELVNRFGGLTEYTRAPAKGEWAGASAVEHDDIVVYEVMVDGLDRAWWSAYRASLELRFGQDEIAVRALAAEKL